MTNSRLISRRTALKAGAGGAALPLVNILAAAGGETRVLRFIPHADLASVDPIWTTAAVTRNHGYLVFDTLYGQTGPESGFAATPQMASGHSIENDGKTWKVTLREGLLFHDGQRVLARDCAASIRRWGARDPLGQTLLQRADDISAADDRTILFRLNKRFPLLLDALGKSPSNMCAIMPERLASTDPYKQVTETVGSGPFRFRTDERVQGSRFVYERFLEYQPRPDGHLDWTSGPKIADFDRVEWHIIPDPATASAALQSGEVDWWELPTADLLPLLKRGGKIKVRISNPTGSCGVLRPNHLFPPFDNPAVRRALLGAVDQADFMTAVMGTDTSLWKVPNGFFPPSSPLASETGMSALAASPDYDKVKKDLLDAGYKGERIVLIAAQDVPILKALSDVAADMMRRAGMNVDYQAADWGTVVQRRASKKPPDQGGWNALCTFFFGVDFLTPATNSPLRGNNGQAWFGWPTSPRTEELRDAWLDAPDVDERKRLATEIQKQAFEDVPYYPLGLAYFPTAYRTNLTDIPDGPVPAFWGVRRT